MKLTVLALLLGASSGMGQNLLTNGSFESAADTSFNGYNYNRTTEVSPWTIDRSSSQWSVARVNQAYCDSAAVQTGPLLGSAGMWLSANGVIQQDVGVSFASSGSGDYTFKVKIGQSSNFTATNQLTMAILDGSGTVLTSRSLTSLSPGDDLVEFSLGYTSSGSENGNVQVRLQSGAGNTNGVFVIDDASLTFEASGSVSNSEQLVEPVVWVGVDTQLGPGGTVKKYWQHRHDQIAERGASKSGVLFVGDSLTDLMCTELSNATGPRVLIDSPHKPTYESVWTSRYKPANYGIAGQVTQNVRWQIANGLYGAGSKPRVISLMIGTNNLHQNALGSGSSPTALTDAENQLDTVAGIKAVVNDLKAWSPGTSILLHSLLPRHLNGSDPVSNSLVENVNADVALWASSQEHVEYVDLYPHFSDGSGGIQTQLYDSDQLHLSTAGYEKWFSVLKPLVDAELPSGPDYLRHLNIPVRRSTIPARPDYQNISGRAGTFGWNTVDTSETWNEAFERSRGTAPTQEAEIVFLGDSVTMAWGSVGGRTQTFSRGSATWAASNYDQYSAVNAGMSGDQTQNLLWRIENGQLDGIGKPKMFVVMIGTNNREGILLGGELVFNPGGAQSSQEIADGVLMVVQRLQALYPQAHIVCQGILRGANHADPERIAVTEANAIVQAAFERDTNPYLHYFDTNDFFIDPSSPNEAYDASMHVGDNVHPNNAGYTAWAAALQPYIDRYVKGDNSAHFNAGVPDVDLSAWQEEVSRGTTAAVTHFAAVPQNAGQSVDLSGISGEASYEFLIRAEDLSQASAILLSEPGASLRVEQWNQSGRMGLTWGGDHQFTPLYGTSVSSPYGGIHHLVLQVHADDSFSHLFLNGELVGVLNRAYTFSSSTALLASVRGEPLGQDGADVVLGFAAYNRLLPRAEIQCHHRAAFCYELPKVEFSVCPQDLQLYPRTSANLDPVNVPVSGEVLEAGYDSVFIRRYRNGVVDGSDVSVPLAYSEGRASFHLSPTILPELAQYRLAVFLRKGTEEVLVHVANNLVAGDVYLLQGQSNAYARSWNGSANENLGPFLRSYGTNPIFQFGESSNEEALRAAYTVADPSWHYAIADEDVDNADDDRSRGHIGQLAARIGARLIEQHQVPVAVISGAHGGKQLSFFQRNDSKASDLKTNYGRLLWKCRQAGVEGTIRGLVFCQGETDDGIIHGKVGGSQTPEGYNAAFASLYDDWQQDFQITHHYAIQIRPKCYDWVVPEDTRLRDYQRRWADEHARFSVFSYNAISGQLDGDFCHYDYLNGYQTMGDQIARAMDRDLYGVTGVSNVDAPNPRKVAFSNDAKSELTVMMLQTGDTLLADAGVAQYFQLEQADGTAIASPSVTGVTVDGHTLLLNLSGPAPANATRLGFKSHKLESSGDHWVTNANGVGMLTFSESIAQSLTPVELWQRDVQGVPPGSDTSTDGDKDGLDELLEHALGQDPAEVSNGLEALPHLTYVEHLGSDYPALQYQRPAGMTHLNYIVQWSDDLVNWSPAAEHLAPEAIVRGGVGEIVTVRSLYSSASLSSRQFLRLLVSERP
ncbi:hypothetical protein HW115_03845 [Verrucomicrobiaceae bacterium N1E253]|uniref:SGNH hydrolase-type esterase domain-containing protein n=1 Tax=Oceaniferula marina TaxID=2748318 RepID=A0A851GHW8_9BACT|nr:GDSL-type esterase/lipase family protein [Oceaniferula marina]NWK54727.1 hypothetical protein [Oceaniferula marina]